MNFTTRELCAIDTALLYRISDLESRIKLWEKDKCTATIQTAQRNLHDTQSAAKKISKMILGEE
ncbi:hypothetical protein GCM10027435_30720 [Haloparvum alkalitolerans]|uniref:hypothetical protein n=1 Tax=Paenibacillus motobuensis TaxID=295324 RepID=UPI00362C63E6